MIESMRFRQLTILPLHLPNSAFNSNIELIHVQAKRLTVIVSSDEITVLVEINLTSLNLSNVIH